jgi:hypothetical protein
MCPLFRRRRRREFDRIFADIQDPADIEAQM